MFSSTFYDDHFEDRRPRSFNELFGTCYVSVFFRSNGKKKSPCLLQDTYHSSALNHWSQSCEHSHTHKHVNRCFHYNQKTCHVLLSFSRPIVQSTHSSHPHSGGEGHLGGTHVRLLCLILTVAKYLKKKREKSEKHTLVAWQNPSQPRLVL